MLKRLVLVGAVSAVACFGQITSIISAGATPQEGTYQVRYAANLAIGDSVVNLTNDGASSFTDGLTSAGLGFQQDGQICANIYVYSPDEQLVSCCSCNVTPNGLNSLSANNDLVAIR